MRALCIAVALWGCGAGATREEPTAGPPIVSEATTPYEFHRAMAYTMLRTDQVARAEPHVMVLRRFRPRSPEPFVLLARIYLAEGLPGQALGALDRAIRLDPRYAPAYAQRGVVLDLQGRHAEAERAHRRSIVLDPGSPAYRNNLGYTLYLQGRYQAAVGAYEAALARGAGMRRLHNNIGFAYAKLGRIDVAMRHFRRAGGEALVDNNMGLVFEDRGDLERAYASYLEAARQDPRMAEARGNLMRVCDRLGRPVPPLPEPEEGAP